MPVQITEDMHKTFLDNGFTENDIANTVNHYRQQGQSDDEIFNNLNNKYQSFKTPKPKMNNTQIQTNTPIEESNISSPYVIEGGISKNVQYRNEHPIKETVRQAGRNTARALLPKNAEKWYAILPR